MPIARITIEKAPFLTPEEYESICSTCAEKLDTDEVCIGEDEKLETYNSYWKTYDPEELKKEKNSKKLVNRTNLVNIVSNKEYLADLNLFLKKHPNIKIAIRGLCPTIETDYNTVIDNMLATQKKFDDAVKSFNKQVEFNEKCDVHVSNLGLLHINQLGYITDACTEALQDIINKGWRIIACCVQPDGRRPDYILGRFNDGEKDEPLKCVKF